MLAKIGLRWWRVFWTTILLQRMITPDSMGWENHIRRTPTGGYWGFNHDNVGVFPYSELDFIKNGDTKSIHTTPDKIGISIIIFYLYIYIYIHIYIYMYKLSGYWAQVQLEYWRCSWGYWPTNMRWTGVNCLRGLNGSKPSQKWPCPWHCFLPIGDHRSKNDWLLCVNLPKTCAEETGHAATSLFESCPGQYCSVLQTRNPGGKFFS